MKYEWKKEAKELYVPKTKPILITVPEFHFFMINGKGNPNSPAFAEVIGVLYSLSYAIKMIPKKGVTPDGYVDFSVFPIEGIWDLEEDARGLEILDKDRLVYTLMMRQPDFVTTTLANEIIEMVKKKKPHPLLDEVTFDSYTDGLCVQMMHIGSYDTEPASFAMMEEYCTQNNLKRLSKVHREIYLSDARKTHPDKLKTVLRFKIGLMK